MRLSVWLVTAILGLALTAVSQPSPACPIGPVRVVRSRGGVIDYLGSVPGIPDLCRMRRTDGEGDFYFGLWRSDWPGAGQAYPALKAMLAGSVGTRTSFITRSYPGLQWTDSFTNEGLETVQVGGVAHRVFRLAHERAGIEGNTYHSIITVWRDVETGATLRTSEFQISGQSYGPDATWTATAIQPLPKFVP